MKAGKASGDPVYFLVQRSGLPLLIARIAKEA